MKVPRTSTCSTYSSASTCQPFRTPPSMKSSHYPLEPVRPIQVFKKVSKIFVLLGALTIHDIQNFLSSNCIQVSRLQRFKNVLLLCQSYAPLSSISSFVYGYSTALQNVQQFMWQFRQGVRIFQVLLCQFEGRVLEAHIPPR